MFGLLRKKSHLPEDTMARSSVPVAPDPIVLLDTKLEAAIHYMRGSHLVYINNAKSGCSSIKKSLWMSRSPSSFTEPHDKPKSPFLFQFDQIAKAHKELESARVFTMVRNPYTRILSAYLDKVATGKGGVAGAYFRNRFGIMGRIPGFSEFLELISSEEPELLDQHFAPQFYTTMYPLIRYDYVGHLEQLEQVGDWLKEWDVPTEEFRPHATNAVDVVRQHYSDHDYEIVRDFFALDFEAFGYSLDPSVIEPVASLELPDVPRGNLADLVSVYTSTSVRKKEQACLRLAQNAPSLDLDYLRLDVGVMSEDDQQQMVRHAEQGRITNWRVLERLADCVVSADTREKLQAAVGDRLAIRPNLAGALKTEMIERCPVPVVDHKIILLGSKLEAAIHHISGYGLAYMNNAKAGCSSVKTALWMSVSPDTFTQPHDKRRSPFQHLFKNIALDPKQLETARIFTMVRNPYVRVLAAYLDDISTGQGGVAGTQFRNRFKITEHIPDFLEYLQLISTEQPELLDQHFAPQFYTTMHPLIRYDFIGHLEEPDKLGAWLKHWKIVGDTYRPHGTDAAELVQQYYSDAAQELVQNYFAVDFEAFGYSVDPTILAPVRPARLPDVPRTNLADLVTAFGAMDDAERKVAFARLEQNAPCLDLNYSRLEVGALSTLELTEMAERVLAEKTASWQVLIRLADEIEKLRLSYDVSELRHLAEERRSYRENGPRY